MSDRHDPPTVRARRPSTALRSVLAPRLGIDPRALGAFRIALGLLVLAQLGYRAPGIATFYTDAGVVPRSTLAEQYPALAAASLHAVSGAAWVQALLFGVAGAFAVLLLVGYRTRLATVVSAALLASLFARNPYVLNGGDTILLAFLFLGAFLPLDARWSVDAARRAARGSGRRDRPDRRVLSVATATTLLFLVVVYATNGAFKLVSDLWMEGVAVRQIFQIERHLTLLGPALAEQPALLTAINWLWTALLVGSVLLVAAAGRLRTALVAAFVAAHLGMAATMRLGPFPFVMIAGLLLFLPPGVWERVDDVTRDRATGVVSALRPDDTDAAAASPGSGVAAPVPSAARGVARVASVAALVCFLLAVASLQASAVGLVDAQAVGPGNAAQHSWTMFGPTPPDEDGWFVAEARLASGETVDALGNESVTFRRPADVADEYPTDLWLRYGREIRYGDEAVYEPFAARLCEDAPGDVERVTVYYVEQPVDTEGFDGEPVPHERISYEC